MSRAKADNFIFSLFTKIKRVDNPEANDITSFDEITDELDEKLKMYIGQAVANTPKGIETDGYHVLSDFLKDYSEMKLTGIFLPVAFLAKKNKYYMYIAGFVLIKPFLNLHK